MQKKVSSRLIESFPIELRREEPQGELGLHSHEFEELVIIRRGHGIHFTESESYRISPGDVFVIREDRAHGYRRTENLFLTNILLIPWRSF